jgi:hypothetical protein
MHDQPVYGLLRTIEQVDAGPAVGEPIEGAATDLAKGRFRDGTFNRS